MPRSHLGARVGRFYIISAACERCGARWQVSGSMIHGPVPLWAATANGPEFHQACDCGAAVVVLLPPNVDRRSLLVSRPGGPSWRPVLPTRRPA